MGDIQGYGQKTEKLGLLVLKLVVTIFKEHNIIILNKILFKKFEKNLIIFEISISNEKISIYIF